MNRDTVPMRVRRSFATDFRAEARSDEGLPHLIGHASVFGVLSEDLGGWKERVWPGAFEGLLSDDGIYSLWNHNPDFIIAAVADGSLTLSEDATGLLSDSKPMNTQTIRDLVITPMQQGKIRKMSCAFDVGTADWSVEDSWEVRNIRKFSRLYDTSPVTYPAFPQTDISARTLEVLVGSLSKSQRDAVASLIASDAAAQAGAAAGRSLASADVEREIWNRRTRLRELVAA